ncbi:MAG: hypothetical protein Q9N68_07825 [Gammaproteobacteria bacterium]|nr:hypothetical protein [Gammaproteobacteria bacterium]
MINEEVIVIASEDVIIEVFVCGQLNVFKKLLPFFPFIVLLVLSVPSILSRYAILIPREYGNTYSLMALVAILFAFFSGFVGLYFSVNINMFFKVLLGFIYFIVVVLSMLLAGF